MQRVTIPAEKKGMVFDKRKAKRRKKKRRGLSAHTKDEGQTPKVIYPFDHLCLALPLSFRLVRQVSENESERENEEWELPDESGSPTQTIRDESSQRSSEPRSCTEPQVCETLSPNRKREIDNQLWFRKRETIGVCGELTWNKARCFNGIRSLATIELTLMSPPPPIPAINLPTNNVSILGANPQSAVPAVNKHNAPSKAVLLPTISASRPYRGVKVAVERR